MRTLLLLLLFITSVHANEVVIDRYTVIEPNATAEQQFPIIQVKTVDIPSKVTFNREAVDVVLLGTGYEQAPISNRSQADIALMQKPLAQINRRLANMTILEMLKAIAGLGYVPVIDPLNRLVAFEKDHGF